MSVALAGRAPATFEIKSATLPLVALLLKSADLPRLSEELAGRFGDLPEFFDEDPLVIDLAPLQSQAEAVTVDFPALIELLKVYRVRPVAVKGGGAEQMRAALAAGLAPAPDAVPAVPRAATPPAPPTLPMLQSVGAPAPEAPTPGSTAMVVDKPLRAGQQIYARGRDLVLLSPVNPGAEVIADGHIHVYAPLRGRAIAGARGNTDARILTLNLQPELVSIAGVYRTSEAPWPSNLLGRAAQVRLAGGADKGKLLVEPFVT
jgi:septum site-determining protein MinC